MKAIKETGSKRTTTASNLRLLLSADLLPETDSDDNDWKPSDSSSSSSEDEGMVPPSPEVPYQGQSMLSLREHAEAAAAPTVPDPTPIEEQADVSSNGESFVTVSFSELHDSDDEVHVGDDVGSGDEFVPNSTGSVSGEGVKVVNGSDDDGEFDEDMEPVGDSSQSIVELQCRS